MKVTKVSHKMPVLPKSNDPRQDLSLLAAMKPTAILLAASPSALVITSRGHPSFGLISNATGEYLRDWNNTLVPTNLYNKTVFQLQYGYLYELREDRSLVKVVRDKKEKTLSTNSFVKNVYAEPSFDDIAWFNATDGLKTLLGGKIRLDAYHCFIAKEGSTRTTNEYDEFSAVLLFTPNENVPVTCTPTVLKIV